MAMPIARVCNSRTKPGFDRILQISTQTVDTLVTGTDIEIAIGLQACDLLHAHLSDPRVSSFLLGLPPRIHLNDWAQGSVCTAMLCGKWECRCAC